MANEYPTLLDLATRTNVDMAVGVVDNASKFVPEVSRIIGRPIGGISYDATILTSKGKGTFREANAGVETTKAVYTKQHVPTFIFDSQMEADKAVADADPFGRDAFLAMEAMTTTEGNFEELANQFYYGVQSTSKGFNGLQESVAAALTFKAGGTTSNEQTSAYLIWNDIRGMHFVYGANGGIEVSNEWRTQKIVRDSKSLTAYVNGMTFWIGLQVMPFSVARICNIEDADNKRLTDSLIAEALEAFPLRSRPNMILTSRRGAMTLQKSRSATTIQTGTKTSAGIEIWAPEPTSSNGIPIIVTEGIVATEAVVA